MHIISEIMMKYELMIEMYMHCDVVLMVFGFGFFTFQGYVPGDGQA